MHQFSTLYIGLDVHQESIAVAYVASDTISVLPVRITHGSVNASCRTCGSKPPGSARRSRSFNRSPHNQGCF